MFNGYTKARISSLEEVVDQLQNDVRRLEKTETEAKVSNLTHEIMKIREEISVIKAAIERHRSVTLRLEKETTELRRQVERMMSMIDTLAKGGNRCEFCGKVVFEESWAGVEKGEFRVGKSFHYPELKMFRICEVCASMPLSRLSVQYYRILEEVDHGRN